MEALKGFIKMRYLSPQQLGLFSEARVMQTAEEFGDIRS